MEDTIGMTIESILNQNYPNKEIIVINDGSDDKTEEILKKYPIKFITTGKIGISNARNLGYNNSNGEFIAFTDADCELDPAWAENILKGFEDEKVGLVGGITHFRTDGSYCSIYRSIEFSKRYNNIKSKYVVWAGGPGSMFRKIVLDELGGFNPKWVHGEDAEISFLVVKHGYKILKQDNAITYHVPESGFKKLIKKGLRDAKAYVRVTKSQPKISLRNKFNTMWYFPYDMIILPLLYLFILFSTFLIPIFGAFMFFYVFLMNLYLIWFWAYFYSVAFVILYSLIPSFQVYSKSKKLKNLFGVFLLHNSRGFAWGIGLLLGIKNIVLRKQ